MLNELAAVVVCLPARDCLEPIPVEPDLTVAVGMKKTSQESQNDSGHLNWRARGSAGGTSPWLIRACCKKPCFSSDTLVGEIENVLFKKHNLKFFLILNLSK